MQSPCGARERLDFDEFNRKPGHLQRMKKICIVSIFLSSVLAVAAQTNMTAAAVREMSLQDCFQEALAHNFDVQIERYVPKISLYDLDAAWAGYDPTVSFSASHSENKSGLEGILPPQDSQGNAFNSGLNGLSPWGMSYNLSGTVSDLYNRNFISTASFPFFTGTPTSRSSSGSMQLQVTQPLLKNFWIDGTRLNIRVAKIELQSSEQGLRGQIINTVTAVEDAYYELIFAQENVEVETQALVLAQTQLDQDKQRVQVGSLAPLDVQQDEAQVAQSTANLIAAQYALATAQNALKNLITDSYAKWHDVDIQPAATMEAPAQTFDLQESWRKGMTQRPDLLQARLDVERQGIQLKFSFNQLFPELDLMGTYGFNGAAAGFGGTFNQFHQTDRPFYSYGAQISIPLSNAGPRNQYKSAKATMQQVVLQLKQLEQNIMVGIDNAVKRAESAHQSVEATRQERIYAEAALDAEQKKYSVGKSTTFTVLQLQNNLTSARSQEIRSLADYNEALADLSQQEGSTLERRGINIEAK